jgi:hypothetical protein
MSVPTPALNHGMELTASSTSSCRPPRYNLNAGLSEREIIVFLISSRKAEGCCVA